jgi:glycosyltransferase involved in cell wall biosynthesis
MPKKEYVQWARKTGIDVLFCDMNLQFKAIAAVRELGVRTIGRFVWERFGAHHVNKAKRAYDVIYSLHRGEQARYRDEFGIDSPYARLGVFPDIDGRTTERRKDGIYFIFHGGLHGPRKPFDITVRAFKAVKNPDIRLIIKSQAVREDAEAFDITDDPRIEYIVEDMPFDEYHALFSSCHVNLCPSRWEGLGVHLFEAVAYGMPTISNDIPPINEVLRQGQSGLLVKSLRVGVRPNGLPIYDPDFDDLVRQIEVLSDPARVAEMEASTVADRARLDWNDTRRDYLKLATDGTTGL